MKQKYILFDLDGTITDPKEGITKSVAYALESFGILVEDMDTLCKFIGPPLRDSFTEFYDFNEEQAELAIKKYREYFTDKGIYENILFKGIPELFEDLLGNGKVIILATSKPTVFAVKILEYFHIKQYFRFIAGSELNLNRATKGEVIQYALEQNGIFDKSEAIMIGDRKHDIIGAKENGIKSVGVLFGYGDRPELQEAGADYIVETIEELEHLLNQD